MQAIYKNFEFCILGSKQGLSLARKVSLLSNSLPVNCKRVASLTLKSFSTRFADHFFYAVFKLKLGGTVQNGLSSPQPPPPHQKKIAVS